MKEQQEYVDCNLCGENETELVSQTGQFNLPVNVVICKKCGLTYLNPRWTKEKYLDFYKNDYDRFYRPAISIQNEKAANEINPIHERLNQSNLLSNPKTILDIGSGSGANLSHFKKIFPTAQLHAIEPSVASANILTSKGIEVLSSDVDSNWTQGRENYFDFVIMRHVLEHFSDPGAVLKKVSKVLSDEALLYIAVPNNLHPTTPLKTNWFRVVHTYYFNKYTLNNLLIKSGLKAVELVEGDSFQPGEVFAFVRKASNPQTVAFNETHYSEQKNIFEKKLKEENKLWPTLRRKMKFFRQKVRL